MAGIVRRQTEAEKDLTPTGADGDSIGFLPIMGPDSKPTAESIFIKEAQKQEKIATRKGLPFAMQVALTEFGEHFEIQAKISLKKRGYVLPSDIKPLKVDWKKYSDLNNFKKIKEDEVPDTNLSNKNPGLDVTVKKTEYKYKGYERYMYRVMEGKESAIRRARAKLKEVSAIAK